MKLLDRFVHFSKFVVGTADSILIRGVHISEVFNGEIPLIGSILTWVSMGLCQSKEACIRYPSKKHTLVLPLSEYLSIACESVLCEVLSTVIDSDLCLLYQ